MLSWEFKMMKKEVLNHLTKSDLTMDALIFTEPLNKKEKTKASNKKF